MNKFFSKNNTALIKICVICIAILCVYIFFNYIFTFVSPFVLGWILSLIFNPFVNFMERNWKVPRGIGTIISILLLIGFFSSVVATAVLKFVNEANLLYEQFPEFMEDIKNSLDNLTNIFNNFINTLPSFIKEIVQNTNTNFITLLTSLLTKNSSTGITAVKAIPNMFLVILLGLISSYFFTKDKKQIKEFLINFIPFANDKHFQIIKKHLYNSLAGYFKTQVILMGYTFSICMIGFIIIKSPYSFLLSVIIALIDSLPVFGSGFILWPGALIYFFIGNTKLAVGYIIIYLVIMLMRQIMQPKILGTQIGVHPLIALISIYVGLKLIGFIGMILGPVIAVIIKAFFDARNIANT